MPAFHPLAVSDVRRETADTVSVAFTVPAELEPAYRFSPGQHLTVRLPTDGGQLRRTYSVCSGVEDGELRIAVKHLPGGAFGTYAAERLRPGDSLDVMTPAGRFTTTLDPARARHLLGIAAGSGITPVISIVRSVLAGEPASRVTLLYGNREPASVIFAEELGDLKDRHLDRLSVVHVFSRAAPDVPLLAGRLTPAKLRALAGRLLDVGSVDEAFVCGPEPMAHELRDALDRLGVPRVHVELFGTAGMPAAAPPPVSAGAGGRRYPLSVLLGGVRSEVAADPEQTVLAAALGAGLDLPYSCTGGVCATCRAHVAAGEATMEVNYALEPEEVAAGYVLTCQARPVSPELTVDFDRP